MSDTQQGPGWWQASDGRWYPPEQHPDQLAQLPAPPVGVQGYVQPPMATITATIQPAKKKRNGCVTAFAVGVGLLVLVGIGAALLGGRSGSGREAADGERSDSTSSTTTTAAPAPGPEELRQQLLGSGLDCGQLGPYVPEPDALDLGVDPEQAVTCTAASGSTIELVFMASPEEVATLLAVAQAFACGFDSTVQTYIRGDDWYAEVFAPDGSVDAELTTAAADALGVEEQIIDCP